MVKSFLKYKYYSAYFLELLPIIISRIDTAIANSAVFQNPSTSNLAPNKESLSLIMKTVMIKDISPKVNQLRGKVNKRRIPPTIIFTKLITTPVIIAHQKFST